MIGANFVNYLDRTIISVLGPSIQADLKLDDTALGFLLGTAFAVLYGVIGIPMGRLADVLSRKGLMATGLSLWSIMTILSGSATSFLGLAAARIGVGVGEATANPVSHCLLSDYFPARNRASVLGSYLASVHLGSGFALVLGGVLVAKWSHWCEAFPLGACTLPGWRAAFMLVGLPGLLLAVLVSWLREPPRPDRKDASVLAIIAREAATAIPPFTVIALLQTGGRRAAIKNVIFLGVVAAVATGLGMLTRDWAQWMALGIGVYSVASWAQAVRYRDLPLFELTFGCPVFLYAVSGGAMLACFVGTIQAWAPTYAMRTLEGDHAKVGLWLGLISILGAVFSTLLGGFVTDLWKRRDNRAPIWVALICLLAPIVPLFLMLHAKSFGVFVPALLAFILLGMGWSGPFAALVQDLVLPRMRGAAAAAFALIIGLVAAGIGPYWAGKISTVTGSLTTGLYASLVFVPIGALLLVKAAAKLRQESFATRVARARAAGERGLEAI